MNESFNVLLFKTILQKDNASNVSRRLSKRVEIEQSKKKVLERVAGIHIEKERFKGTDCRD